MEKLLGGDSMPIYKGRDIGTAKNKKDEEKKGWYSHHLNVY